METLTYNFPFFNLKLCSLFHINVTLLHHIYMPYSQNLFLKRDDANIVYFNILLTLMFKLNLIVFLFLLCTFCCVFLGEIISNGARFNLVLKLIQISDIFIGI